MGGKEACVENEDIFIVKTFSREEPDVAYVYECKNLAEEYWFTCQAEKEGKRVVALRNDVLIYTTKTF
jgi:hypothetical protein